MGGGGMVVPLLVPLGIQLSLFTRRQFAAFILYENSENVHWRPLFAQASLGSSTLATGFSRAVEMWQARRYG
jgi:hypothetical protein